MSTPRQRLVLCLDGTWNNRDDSTNVLHQHVLTFDGVDPKSGFHQRVYYDEGVGNGLLDGITGGGFGIGLEKNVREAYNWLVEHFNDAPGPSGYVSDEIYVFGFSRGAYTARSLVGFISRCGLLRRGAPLTVNQLWHAYCLIGRDRETRRSPWDAIAGKAEPPFRSITSLVTDPWQGALPRADLQPPATPAEKLLVEWSRRVRIRYLGLYDTVGAMGLDALAIPGLRGRIALHHNMRPTTLVEKCRHALALDENRASFAHTPFVAYYGHDRTAGRKDKTWPDIVAMWNRRIEQTWFVGAHSNIGGSYENNTLSQRPFNWVFEGAMRRGLVAKPSSHSTLPVPPADLPAPNDSYARFAAPLGTHLLRLKRNYRVIDPPPEIRAALPRTSTPCPPDEATGFHLGTINESVHPSVLAYYQASPAGEKRTLPPHLLRHALAQDSNSDWGKLARVPDVARPHSWPEGPAAACLVSALWGSAAGFGLVGAIRFFTDGPIPAGSGCAAACAAAFFIWVDATESRLGHRLAAMPLTDPARPRRQALRDAIFWIRSLGVVLAVVGLASAAVLAARLGWRAGGTGEALAHVWLALKNHAGLLAAAALAVPVAAALVRDFRPRHLLALVAPLAAAALVPLAALSVLFIRHLLGVAAPGPASAASVVASDTPLAAQILLLQIGLLVLARTFAWTGAPLQEANLPSIIGLQKNISPAGVASLLEDWRRRLVCLWNPADADARSGPSAARLRAVLAASLWRDIFGLVPLYSLVLGHGLWLAIGHEAAVWGPFTLWGLPAWLCIVALAAVADWAEDFLHLGYLSHHAKGTTPGRLHVLAAATASLAKTLLFVVAALGTLAALAIGLWRLAQAQQLDPRGSLALLLALAAGAFLAFVAWTWARKKIKSA